MYARCNTPFPCNKNIPSFFHYFIPLRGAYLFVVPHHAILRNFLTNKQKVIVKKEIIRRRGLYHRINLEEISEWAQTTLKIAFKPSKPVIYRLQSLLDIPNIPTEMRNVRVVGHSRR